ncbi:hypothetical protein BH11ACT1_BH11ACT1_18850 [soil metagenome]
MTTTYETPTGSVERVRALPQRTPAASRVRLRVRVPADLLSATMGGLAALDEAGGTVLSHDVIAAAPPLAPGIEVRRVAAAARRTTLD